jgi:hypothetical protein
MQAQNTLFYKVQQQHNKNALFVLCSFALNSKATFTQAQAVSVATTQRNATYATVAKLVAQLQQQHNAASVKDVTTCAVHKLLARNTHNAAA